MQDEQKFKVIYCGRLQDGVDPQRAAVKLAKAFKIKRSEAQTVLGYRKDTVIKRGTVHQRAYAMKRAMEDIGMVVRLERVVEGRGSNAGASVAASHLAAGVQTDEFGDGSDLKLLQL